MRKTINGRTVRTIYQLIDPVGEVLASAGQRWILERDLEDGYVTDYDDDGVPYYTPTDGCEIVEVWQ
jgi:hypothetical protein